MIDYLDLFQKINNLIFKILGENSISIDLQVYINGKRHELDLPDEKELIEDYVQ